MALTTMAGVNAGLLPVTPYARGGLTPTGNKSYSFWAGGSGFPPAAVAIAVGLSGAALTAPVQGQLPIVNPPSGEIVLARWTYHANGSASSALLVDRLWHNSGINLTITSAQTITSAAWPARDKNQSTSGDGVFIALEVQTITGAGVPVATISYTNSAGTAGRTATTINALAASTPAGQFFIFALQDGDLGVRSIESFTLSATWTSGAISLVAFRVIAMIPAGSSTGIPNAMRTESVEDVVTLCAPRIWDSSVPHLVVNTTGSANYANVGSITLAIG